MAYLDSTPGQAVNDFDPDRWAQATSQELLAVQAENRKLTLAERSERVEGHLRHRIASVETSQRQLCLHALASHFPLVNEGWGQTNGHESSGESPASAVPQTPSEWVAGFDSIQEKLTPDLKKQLVEKLKAAGCLPSGPAPTGGLAVPPSLEALLSKDSVDPTRIAQLLEVVFEATRNLDGNFRRVWEGIAEFGHTDHGLPRNSLEDVMRKFLAGDQDVPRVVLKNRVETTTKLIPAVLIGVKESWDAMETSLGKCLPEEIQKRVKKSVLGGDGAKYWNEYLKSAEQLQPEARVREFFERIVSKARVHIPR